MYGSGSKEFTIVKRKKRKSKRESYIKTGHGLNNLYSTSVQLRNGDSINRVHIKIFVLIRECFSVLSIFLVL